MARAHASTDVSPRGPETRIQGVLIAIGLSVTTVGIGISLYGIGLRGLSEFHLHAILSGLAVVILGSVITKSSDA